MSKLIVKIINLILKTNFQI